MKKKKEEQWINGQKPKDLTVVDSFLWESNAIEDEWSEEAFEDAKKAWDYASKQKKMNHVVIKEIHRILMQRVWPQIAGKWRHEDIMIGGKVVMYHSERMFDHQVTNLGVKLRMKVPTLTTEKEEFAKKLHVKFEQIHPFRDGNGRTGRIIYNWHRLQLGLPIHVIHHGEEQMAYYGWFKTYA